MQLVGKSLHYSKSGILVAKRELSLTLKEASRLVGKNVFTEKKGKIGVISDIFGPVLSPYISVKLMKSSKTATPEKFVEKALYIGDKNASEA